MNSKPKDLLLLIEGCIKGERRAQHKLFKSYYSLMFNVCMRYAANQNEAEDMLNEGFLKIFSNLNKYENTGSFDAWMKRVMANAAIDYQRKYKSQIDTVDYQEITETAFTQYDENNALSHLTNEELMKLIQQLPNMSRNVFNLYVFENYSHSEIAQILSIKEGTSHWHLNFARTKLKKDIKAYYGQ